MKSMVVLSALLAVACGSLLPLAQPVHHPAVVLDPHGRPLDTAEVINARALHLQAKALEGHHAPLVHAVAAPVVAHAPIVAAPAAVSHQSRVDIHSSPAIFTSHVAPVLAHASPVISAHGLFAGHGHWLKKRSLGYAPLVAHAPIVHAAPSAVSHQSRVDVISSPAVVSHSVVAPVVSHAPVIAHAAPVIAHHAPVVAHVAPAAVSHQSRVDVRTSPAVVAHSVIAPVHAASVYGAHASVYGSHASVYGSHAGLGLSHGHWLKKRSLGHYLAPVVHAAPSAVSHQSRVDVISSPAVVSHSVVAPVVAHAAPVVAHVAPAAVSHQSRVDVIQSHHAPLAHSAVWSAPSYLGHSGLLHSHAALAHW